MARIRVTRVLVFEGPEDWVRSTLERSWVGKDRPQVNPMPSNPPRAWSLHETSTTEEILPEPEEASGG